MRQIIFWGATGQAKVLREALDKNGTLIALFDNREIDSPFSDVPIFHGESALVNWISTNRNAHEVHACVSIGGDKGAERLHLQRLLSNHGFPPITIVHRRAFVAGDATIGKGCQILALAAVCTAARLGDAVIVNTSASIDHDCIIGDGVHVAPGARLAGEVIVGDFAFIGTGSVILPRVRIGRAAIIGAGAVVTRDVPDSTIVAGNPAKPFSTFAIKK